MFRLGALRAEPPVPAPPRRARTALDEQLCSQIAKLETVAQHLVEGTFEASTNDNEDHTFSGIMFPIECRDELPVQFIEIKSVAVRGELGPMSVYTCSFDPYGRQRLYQVPDNQWERRFGPEDVPRSNRTYRELHFRVPLRLAPGQTAGIYVHSELPGDRALVYDDQRHSDFTYRDEILNIHPGIAHTSNEPFSGVNLWGGPSWRIRREFVGKIKYGTKFLLWTPNAHSRFPDEFRAAVFAVLCSHSTLGQKRLRRTTLGDIPVDVLFRVINFLPHDWFNREEEQPRAAARAVPTRSGILNRLTGYLPYLHGGGGYNPNDEAGGDEDEDEEDDPDWEEGQDEDMEDEDDEDEL